MQFAFELLTKVNESILLLQMQGNPSHSTGSDASLLSMGSCETEEVKRRHGRFSSIVSFDSQPKAS
jgi:hypothetical protein